MDLKRMRIAAPIVGASLLLAPMAGSFVQAQAVPPSICFGITTSQARAQGFNTIDLSGTTSAVVTAGTADPSRPDFFVGGSGNDTFDAQVGDDIACGKEGNDQIFGGAGADRLKGGPGNDLIFGDLTQAQFTGFGGTTGTGANVASGVVFAGVAGGSGGTPENGNDLIQGGRGDDQLAGNDGDDVIRARDGDDRVRGGPGRDMIDCGAGVDLNEPDAIDISVVNCEANLGTTG